MAAAGVESPQMPVNDNRRPPVYAQTAAAATSHPLASGEALAVLRAGGSAADAAIAASAVLCLAEPQMTGVGGDCFVLIKTPEQKTPMVLNGSGWTPQNITAKASAKARVAHSITIPGAVAAWKALHNKFGKLPFARLFDSAIRYAVDGCPVAARVAQDWQREARQVQTDDDAAVIFLPDGLPPKEGDIHRQPKLAATLATIAEDGGESFYRGAIAEDIIGKLQQLGGTHNRADFADYKPEWQKPVSGDYRNWRIWQCPPNGQGAVVLLMLAAMAQTDMQNLSPSMRAHKYAVITRLSYQWRDVVIGDEKINARQIERVIAAQAKRIIAAVQSNKLPPKLSPPPEHRDTVYLAVADGDGMCVSFINSIFHPFGSGIVAPKSGVLLHNRGASFVRTDGHPNQLAPRKRPMHTIIPAIAESAQGTMAFGVMGGHYQAAGQAWFLHKFLDEGLDLQQALDAPRFFNYPDKIYAEESLDAQTRAELQKQGHTIAQTAQPLGGGQVVLRAADGKITAASDHRKDGIAAGF